MVQLKISGKISQETANQARRIGELCQTLKQTGAASFQTIEIMGPIEASLTRIAGRYRWQILLKASSTRALHQFINQLMAESKATLTHRRVQLAIDVDPVFLM